MWKYLLQNIHHCCAYEKVEPDKLITDDVNAMMSFCSENLKPVSHGHLLCCDLKCGPYLRSLAKNAGQLEVGNDSGQEGRGTKKS